MIENVAALRIFVRAARSGSFSRVAQEMGLSQPTVSRTIANLEADLGASLFSRSTRAISLTEGGADYLERIETILAALDDANHAVQGSQELRGSLRIGLSSSFALRQIIRRLPRFVGRHPALSVDLQMDDRRQDLLAEGVDVALRLGQLPDSSAVARKITSIKRVIAAAPKYLAEAGIPLTLDDLSRHRMIAGPGSSRPNWTFRKDGVVRTLELSSKLSVSVNAGAVAAAVAGLGVVATGMIGDLPEFEDGTLVRLLPDWELEPIEVHAVYSGGRLAKPAARIFVEFLVRDFAAATDPSNLLADA